MDRQRALAGVLVLFASAHRAFARPNVPDEHDVVALVQRTAATRSGRRAGQLIAQAENVQQSLNSLLAERRIRLAGIPLSLLAVNSSATSGWYDMDDGLLLQKLHDRMKANEEKEQQEIANSQAQLSRSTPEGYLSQTPASAKQDATKWLTQADLDHYAEDERRLTQLKTELQRVAASLAHIATHQRDVGMHLGLPDPSLVKFETGDRVEIQVGDGRKAGSWVKATILGPGDRANTWNVHVHSAKTGKKDLPNIPSIALRRDEDIGMKVFEPATSKYELGEQAQVQIAVGPLSGQWVKCSIRSKAELPDTYNIYVPSAPPGHREIPSVPARVLRKAESKALFNQYDMDGDGQLSNEEFSIAMKEKATTVYEEAVDKSGLRYQNGDTVQLYSMEGKSAGMWINVTMMGVGDLANTWNIFVPDAQPGFQYVQNIPGERIRKVGEKKDAGEALGHPIRIIPPEADHEAYMKSGPYKDHWVPCELKRQSDTGDSYTISVPYGAPEGRPIVPNVINELLRERKTCGEGYEDIFDADSPGYDHYDRAYNRKETAEECAEDCSRRFSCGSFEWSPSIKECHLNKVINPSLPANGDYIFCRRSHIPKSAAELWKGPWIGQELEFFIEVGEFNGTWHPCKLEAYGQKPDTYDILAPVDFMGKPGLGNWSAVPVSLLRYAKDSPIPFLADNWEPPEGEEALFLAAANATEQANASNASASEVQAAMPDGAVGNATAEEAAPQENASLETALVAANTSENATNVSDIAAPLEDRPAAAAAAVAEPTSAPVAAAPAAPAAEVSAAPKTEAGKEGELGDLGEDLPEGTFRAGQAAEVRQAGRWVKCRVLKTGEMAGTYNLRLLGDGSKEMKNIPATAMRRLQKTASEDSSSAKVPLDVGGIDGEVGEIVEVLVTKGPHTGDWVPAIIKGMGSEPDSYNIKVPSMNATNKTVLNVKGGALRKTNKKIVIVDDTQYPTYSVGEHAIVNMPLGTDHSIAYNCIITGKGAAVNTYDLEVPSFGTFPAAHAKLLQKLPENAPEDSSDDQLAVNLKATMEIINSIGADLLPVLNMILDDRKELRAWLRRTQDWEIGCHGDDRSRLVARIQELSAMPADQVAAALPEDCSLESWAPEGSGFQWDLVGSCVQSAANVSHSCSNCPLKFMMTAADKCVPKCTPMMSLCKSESDLSDGKCQGSAGRCLDCLAGPGKELMECAEMPERLQVLTAFNQMIKNSRGSQDMQMEAELRDALSVTAMLNMDDLARKSLRALLFSWAPFTKKKKAA